MSGAEGEQEIMEHETERNPSKSMQRASGSCNLNKTKFQSTSSLYNKNAKIKNEMRESIEIDTKIKR